MVRKYGRGMGWHGESQRHSLASQGIKTSMGNRRNTVLDYACNNSNDFAKQNISRLESKNLQKKLARKHLSLLGKIKEEKRNISFFKQTNQREKIINSQEKINQLKLKLEDLEYEMAQWGLFKTIDFVASLDGGVTYRSDTLRDYFTFYD